MATEFTTPAFWDDKQAKFLLKAGPAFINVFENGMGDQFFGSAHSRRDLADKAPKRRRKPIYRIVVRLKK